MRQANGTTATQIALGLATIAAGSFLLDRPPLERRTGNRAHAISAVRARRRQLKPPATVIAARRLNRAAGMLALSVLADSGVEHYRGSFENKAMFTPLIVSALTLGTSIHGTADRRGVAHVMRDTTYLLAAATGLIGTGFHIYNVAKKAGGFSWQNLFYGAPLGAPMAILLSGLIGFARSGCAKRPAARHLRFSIFRPAGRWPRSPAGGFLEPPVKPRCCISAERFTTRS